MHDSLKTKESYRDTFVTLYCGDVLEVLRDLPSESVHCVVTSPPYYGLRDYGTAQWEGGIADCDHTISKPDADAKVSFAARDTRGRRHECLRCGAQRLDDQVGLEESPQAYVTRLVEIFEEVRRVLRSDGVLWLNLGDSYASSWPAPNTRRNIIDNPMSGGKRGPQRQPSLGWQLKEKDLMGIPWRVAFALQDAGWWLRSDVPWVKRSAMPESVTDRPAKALEYFFQFTKSARYVFDMEAVRKPLASSSVARLSQDVAAQSGSDRVPCKTNGPMKAVRFGGSKYGENGEAAFSPKSGNEWNPQEAGRSLRNSDLWFESVTSPHGLIGVGDDLVRLDVNPGGFKESHFATFPPKLIEPLIKGGSGGYGCCAACGKPYERIVVKGFTAHDGETESAYPERSSANRLAKLRQAASPRGTEYGQTKSRDRSFDWSRNGKEDSGSTLDSEIPQTSTVGWQKACKCETDEIVPCTVLEPFAGAGTTLVVAKKLGRRSIGIELNPEYAEMAANRIKRETEMPLFDA